MESGKRKKRVIGLSSMKQLNVGFFFFPLLSMCVVTARRIFAQFVQSRKRISEGVLLVTCCKKQHFSDLS